MRKIISSTSHNSNSLHTRWNKLIPLKVNILAWRVSNKRIPTRYNLDRRGIDLHSTRCPVCDNDIETEEHLFVKCPIAIASWKMVFSWWQLVDIPLSNRGDVLTMAERTPMTKAQKKFFDAVVNTTIWAIWNYRNKVIFNLKRPQKELHFSDNPSLGNNKYVITFIDDASRYCYVYLLHAKHEALDKFKIYKQEVELQRQDLIKVLRTDRGGEYYDPDYFQSTEPNDYVSVNSIIESRDAIFDEDRFTSIPRLRGTRDKTLSQHEYCFIIKEDPRTLSEAMASRDVAFWKEAIQSEICLLDVKH
ncbi:zinc finger, CCHC-type containing protein [Tanacetum coccineum]